MTENKPEYSLDNLEHLRHRSETNAVLSNYIFDGYLEAFDLKTEDLQGKVILDLGSGEDEEFSREAAKYGAVVTSVNPKLFDKQYQQYVRDHVANLPGYQNRSVAARAQELPFDEDSFDLVVAHWSITIYLPKDSREIYEDEMARSVAEVLRVLKPGGRCYCYPIETRRMGNFPEKLTDPHEILEQTFGKQALGYLDANLARVFFIYPRKVNDPTCVIEKSSLAVR